MAWASGVEPTTTALVALAAQTAFPPYNRIALQRTNR